MDSNFIVSIMRSLFFMFDSVIYSFIQIMYKFIKTLAQVQIFTQGDMQAIADRIYAFIGIFVIFRLAIVLLNAIIDPEQLLGKEKGFPKLMGKTIIALGLIVAVPWAFNLAYQLQQAIIKNDIITRIVLGPSSDDTGTGGNIGKTALESLLRCNEDQTITPVCSQSTLDGAMTAAFPAPTAIGTPAVKASFKGLSSMLNDKSTDGNGDEVYTYDYTIGLSTICGGFILVLLISFAFDIGVRVVKLGFLQLISPVAVLGYVDPKGSIFKNWLDQCKQTFISLFVRLLAISFVVYIISLLPNLTITNVGNNLSVDVITLAFIKIFVILGALMFAKDAPKMIMDMLGIKDSGGLGSLNPLKKLGAVPFIGGAAAGALTTGIAGARGLGLKGLAGAGGSIRGGLNSKFRGGSYRAGATRGSAAAMKNVPLKGKFGEQFKGFTGAGRKAADAGKTSATGKESKTGFGVWAHDRISDTAEDREQIALSKQIADFENEVRAEYYAKGAVVENMFDAGEFKVALTAMRTAKADVKAQKIALTAANNNATIKENEYNGLLASGVAPGDPSVTAKLAELQAAQLAVTNANKAVTVAEGALEVRKGQFEEQKKLNSNKKNAEKYDTWKNLDDTNRL